MITAIKSKFTDALMACGVKPLILSCQESSFIATRFYLNVRKISSKYKYSIVFPGVKNKLSKKTIYKRMYLPNSFDINNFNPLPFQQKKFLTMVIAAKGIKSRIKKILLPLFYGLSVRETSGKRRQAIKYFSNTKDFDLYGFGWEKTNYKDLTQEEINKVFRGAIDYDKKIDTVRQYKFSICFENSIFPGNTTEKIFDCFFAGSIPIYLGDPNITECIPSNCFIDFKKFKDFKELENYLKNMDEAQYSEYIENIRNFLNSDKYYKFSEKFYTNQIWEIIKEEYNYAKA